MFKHNCSYISLPPPLKIKNTVTISKGKGKVICDWMFRNSEAGTKNRLQLFKKKRKSVMLQETIDCSRGWTGSESTFLGAEYSSQHFFPKSSAIDIFCTLANISTKHQRNLIKLFFGKRVKEGNAYVVCVCFKVQELQEYWKMQPFSPPQVGLKALSPPSPKMSRQVCLATQTTLGSPFG